jgi:hypothetical protein
MMQRNAYRVLTRKQAVLLLLALLALGLLATWLGTQWMDALSRRQSELLAKDPQQAALALADQLRIMAAGNGVLLVACAGLLVWYGVKGLRTASMPPLGSWIIEGQRIRTGPEALTMARLSIALGLLLVVLAGTGALILWRLAWQVQTAGGTH